MHRQRRGKLTEGGQQRFDILLRRQPTAAGQSDGILRDTESPAQCAVAFARMEMRAVYPPTPDFNPFEALLEQLGADRRRRAESCGGGIVKAAQITPGGPFQPAGAVQPQVVGEARVIRADYR
jgi:hypothetical protein